MEVFGQTITILQCLIICPLLFAAGFIDSIAGGGGLISLPAYLIAGLPAHNAIATNKLSSTMGTAVATVRYAGNGYIRWNTALLCAVCAVGGSYFGANLSLLISDTVLKTIMLFLLPVTAFVILRKKEAGSDPVPFSEKKTAWIASVIALVLGTYDGFYGPGTGTFLILLLTLAAHIRLADANGITKVINLASNATSLAVYLLHGKAWIFLGLIAGLFNMAGNYFGSRCFMQSGSKIARPVMLLVLAIFMGKVIWEVFF